MSALLVLVRDLRDPRGRFTLGKLQVGQHKLDTLERGWIPNPDGGASGKRFESCVGAGTYRLVPHPSEKFGNVWALVNSSMDVFHYPDDVPKGREPQSRAACLIHAANYWHELLGCIAPGRAREQLPDGTWMVTRSRDALNVIRTVVGSQLDVRLEIRWADGLFST